MCNEQHRLSELGARGCDTIREYLRREVEATLHSPLPVPVLWSLVPGLLATQRDVGGRHMIGEVGGHWGVGLWEKGARGGTAFALVKGGLRACVAAFPRCGFQRSFGSVPVQVCRERDRRWVVSVIGEGMRCCEIPVHGDGVRASTGPTGLRGRVWE